MAKIDLGQIDEFKYTFTEEVVNNDVPVWNAAEAQFEPKQISEVYEEPIVFRRAMLLMGG